MADKKPSQNEQVLELLKQGKSINRDISLREYGCFAISARIADLRKRGVKINTELVYVRKGIKRAMYSLDTEKTGV